ncbi:MAG: hypothetical protein A2539_09305 [Elusimicrobia bacterium RIFOXYD2_FULL_34_15]|nr:MAG: hypothetical protein A2539_09305 [Elusimicrobia bacterium RIFOXYD2_FULL_34_15]
MKKLLFLIGLLVVPSLIFSVTEYVPKSIDGGWVRRIVEAPSAPGTFYAVSYGLYKSTDGGQTWIRKTSVQPSDSFVAASTTTIYGNHHTGSVAVSSSNANLVLVADEGWSPLWRSTDGGENWTCISLGATNEMWKRAAIVTSSLYNSDYFFAAIQTGTKDLDAKASVLNMSTDGGLTWAEAGLTVTSAESITDVLQIPSGANAGRIIVSVVDEFLSFNRDNADNPTTGKVYYSTNSGVSFTQASSFTEPAYQLTWDSTNNKIWMITCKGDIYSSADGASWGVRVSSVPLWTTAGCHRPVGILYSDTTPPSMLAYANTGTQPSASICRSTDAAGGFPANSWYNITLPDALDREKINSFINDIVVDSRYADGSHWGVAESEMAFFYTTSTALGTTTSNDFQIQRGITTPNIRNGIKDKSTNRLYVLADHNIFYSHDNGDSWSRVYPQKGGSADFVRYLAFAPDSATKVYLMANLKIYYTNDNGTDNFANTLVDFSAAPYNYNFMTQFPTNLIIDPTNTNIMYIGIANSSAVSTTDNYLYKTTNAGTNWNKITSLPVNHGIYYIAMATTNPSVMYVACGDENQYGGNFTGHGDGLYKTTDGGSTWTNIGFSDTRISNISIDPTKPEHLIVGYQYVHTVTTDTSKTGGGCAISLDSGVTWEDLTYMDQEPPKPSDNKTEVPTDEGKLQLATKRLPARSSGNRLYSDLTFIFDGLIYNGTNAGYIYMSSDLGATPLKPVALLPTAVSWLFRGSVMATSGCGLFDITFTTGTTTSTTTYTAYSGTDIKLYNYPNPFNPKKSGNTTIKLSLTQETKDLKLKIYSLSGDLVLENSYDNVVGGFSYTLEWDGKNQKGELCAPGVYIIIAETKNKTVKNKIVMVY